MHYATILNGPETLAADIVTNDTRDRFVVRMIDEEARRDSGVDAIVDTYYATDVDDAMRHANAWVTQTPLEY
jgi:hypothetical protein